MDQQKCLDAYLRRSLARGAGADTSGINTLCDEQSSGPAVIATMAGPHPLNELQRRKHQANTAQNHVQRQDDRKP